LNWGSSDVLDVEKLHGAPEIQMPASPGWEQPAHKKKPWEGDLPKKIQATAGVSMEQTEGNTFHMRAKCPISAAILVPLSCFKTGKEWELCKTCQTAHVGQCCRKLYLNILELLSESSQGAYPRGWTTDMHTVTEQFFTVSLLVMRGSCVDLLDNC